VEADETYIGGKAKVACFRADSAHLDHMSFESTSWNDIRDRGDHFAAQHIPIVWGAGRRGAGNNLFIFARIWPHEERTLNLWGSAFLRS